MEDIIKIPSFSLTTRRLSLYNTIVKPISNGYFETVTMTPSQRLDALKNIYGDEYATEKRFHNFDISISAKKSIIEKINWLYFMAQPRNKTTNKGAHIFNFRINFITLTLPSKQMHPTAQITKDCLNQFITEMREKYNMQNFVWRLEFQKNGNVHYHIVTDTYLDYTILLRSWNRIVSKLGYLTPYTEKHALMTLTDYINEYGKGNTNDFEKLKASYSRGRALGWKVPNSVDVRSVLGSKKIGMYISKYFGKKEKTGIKCNELDTKENSMGMRLWFCSRSLSKLKKITDFVQAFKFDLLALVSAAKDLFTVYHEYCTTLFYSLGAIEWEYRNILNKILRDYCIEQKYKPDEV